MSVQAMGWVLDHSPTKGSDRLVLISIANHAGKAPGESGAWEAWPGLELIRHEAGLDRLRTVQDSLARLIAAGALEREVNGAPDERIRKDHRPNLYRIRLDHGVTCGDTRCSWCGVTYGAARGDGSRRDGVTDRDATGCRDASPEPSVEPIDEPSVEPTPLLIVAETPPDRSFDEFWIHYPKRNGKRLGRADAEKAWGRLIAAERLAVMVAVDHYADACRRKLTIAKDAHRWLAGAWKDWDAPAVDDRGDAPRERISQWDRSEPDSALDFSLG